MVEKHILDFPWNFDDLFIKTNKLLKNNFQSRNNEQNGKQKILILGGYTTDILEKWIRIYANFYGCNIEVDKSNWGGAFKLVSSIKSFDNYDLVVCINHIKDLEVFNNNHVSVPETQFVKSELSDLLNKCNQSRTSVLITKFWFSNSFFLTNNDNRLVSNNIDELNNYISEICSKNPIFSFIDFEQISSYFDGTFSSPIRDWYQFGHILNPTGSILFGHFIARKISYLRGMSKKVLVVDLDNTLWGGVIGDDGVNNLELGDETPRGRIYLDLQRYILWLKSRGVMLAIVSKNNENIAKEGFNHTYSALKWDDFSAKLINWEPKSENIKKVAKKLNVGLNSLVFIDDNPFERSEVRTHLPEVLIPDCGENPEDFIVALNLLDPFNQIETLTEEDKIRNKSFTNEQDRLELLENTTDLASFLEKINTVVSIKKPDVSDYNRCIQLTNKTNQFNLTGRRISNNDFKKLINNEKYDIYIAKISDKFGDYGITSIIYVETHDTVATIKNWVMSCRVFSKTAENAIFVAISTLLIERGIKSFKSSFIKNQKNEKFKDLWTELGFTHVKEKSDNTDHYHYSLDENIQNTINQIKHYCEIRYE